MNSKQYLQETVNGFETLIDKVIELVDGVDHLMLNTPEAAGKWTMLQCIKHMSLATEVYVKNVEEKLQSTIRIPSSTDFKGSWKGRMFARMNEPKADGKIPNKLKTFKRMEPKKELNRNEVVDEFIKIHQNFSSLIRKSEGVNLDKTKIPTAIPVVKLSMGDAFGFLLAHTKRHVVQLERIKKTVLSAGPD